MKIVQMGPRSTFKQRTARFGRGVGLAALLAMSVAGTALADNPALTITGSAVAAVVSPVTYSIDNSALGATNTIALNGAVHTIDINVPVAVSDYSGADAGWHTDLAMSAFKDLNGAGPEDDVLLGETSLDITVAAEADCDTSGGKVCSNNDDAVENHVSDTIHTPGGTGTKIFSSDNVTHVASIGMGQYTYATGVGFTLPRTAKVGEYSSTLTVTAVSAP